jgi:hypothetical protein
VAFAQVLLATLFIVYIAMLVVDFDDEAKERLLLLSTIGISVVFIASFYIYVASFGTKLSIYPLFISEEKNGYSTLVLDLSQIAGLLLVYRLVFFWRTQKKQRNEKVSGVYK